MKMFAFLLFFLASQVKRCVGENNDMVVFVHGFGGSSEHFMYQAEFESAGLQSVAVDVNPYGSDHDRACEAYAQIMGTVVDYGVCHSQETGQERFGEDFTGKGLYPAWSELDHIHLIGHSQGGLTVRYMERMMELGTGCEADTSPFLVGGKPWITSISTFATPNNGAGFFDPNFEPLQVEMLRFQANKNNLGFPQFHLTQQPGETFDDFFSRMRNSGFFHSSNFAFSGMTVEAMKAFNEEFPKYFEGRYYFAVATERTDPYPRCVGLVCDTVELPNPKMNDFYKASATTIGTLALPADRENDGIVSNRQARCPFDIPCVQVTDGDVLTWKPSVWHFIDLYFLDHMQLVLRDDENDSTNFQESAKRVWLEHGVRVKSLPSNSALTTRVDAFETQEQSRAVERYLEAMKVLSAEETPPSGTPTGAIALVTSMTAFVVIFIAFVAYKRTNRNKVEPSDFAMNATL